MKKIWLTFLALAVMFSMQSVQADSSARWGTGTDEVQTSHDLRWKAPKTSKVVTAGYDSTDTGVIRQVQQLQPTPPPPPPIAPPKQPAPMTPAQRDMIFPESRPQSFTPPSGATSTPLAPSSSSATMRTEEPARSFEPNASSRQSSSSSGSSSGTTAPVRKENPAVELKDPALGQETLPVPTNATPAPQPLSTYTAPSNRRLEEIPCPDNAGFKSIRDITYDIRPMPIDLPKECPLTTTTYSGRYFNRTCFQWKASALCTKGAYFEDAQLERYGHSVCPVLEPVISGARFFLTVPILPYKMGLTPPNECVYDLGYYRVGNCAPYMLDPLPISVRALLFEGAAIGGAVALIP